MKSVAGVAVRRRDSGPQWLLALHGLQSNQDLFADLLTLPQFQQYSVLTLDLLGFGESEKPKLFSYDLWEQARRVGDVLAAEKIDRAAVIGHSLGGMVGTLLLKLIPQTVEKLISLEGNLTKLDCGESLRVSQLNFSAFKQAYQSKITIPDYAFYKTSKSIVAWSESNELATLFQTTPQEKLLVLGEKSQFHSRPVGPQITLQTIPGATHFMLREQPETTYRLIETFLRK